MQWEVNDARALKGPAPRAVRLRFASAGPASASGRAAIGRQENAIYIYIYIMAGAKAFFCKVGVISNKAGRL